MRATAFLTTLLVAFITLPLYADSRPGGGRGHSGGFSRSSGHSFSGRPGSSWSRSGPSRGFIGPRSHSRGSHNYYNTYPRHYHRRHYYGGSLGFGFSSVYAPSYVTPGPYVYSAPMVVAPAPAVVAPPPAVVAPPVVSQSPSAQQPPPFVETARRYHEHGSDAGLLDWVEGLLNGRPVRIYYDDYGRIEKQKWLD